jgi:hypothetical protein
MVSAHVLGSRCCRLGSASYHPGTGQESQLFNFMRSIPPLLGIARHMRIHPSKHFLASIHS